MKRVIAADLYRHGGLLGLKGLFSGLLLIPGFRYIYLFRKASHSKRYSISWLFYTLLKRRYSFKYGFQIPLSTKIGEGLYIGHFGPIVINGNAIIGKNCKIAHGVTIGQTNRGENKGVPIIGDNVWIGTGVVIVGKVTIGSNVLIAPNTYVNFSIPDNSLVLGNPAKVFNNEQATKDYITNVLM